MRSLVSHRTVLGVLPVLAVAVLGTASHAGATEQSAVGVVCAAGSHTSAYNPPVINTPRTTTVTSTENFSCTSVLTGVSSGSGTSASTLSLNCLLTVSSPFSATWTYEWNTGETSTITFGLSEAVKAADGTTVVTSTGSVTAGLGQGSLAVKVTVMPQLSLTACATTGVSAVTGPATLTILP
ncbi:hypothetical protein ACWDTR_23405 [Streptomyces sp. NPDC003470]